jgi:hypothetical protein
MRALALAIAFSAQLAAAALACGPPASNTHPLIPALAVRIDELLPQASLSSSDRQKVVVLREKIRQLAEAGDEAEARKAEEQAMLVLGYRKGWLRCGPGTFVWIRDDPPAGS